jgi:hypothetical protein
VLAISPDQRLVIPGTLIDELLECLLGVLRVQAVRELDAAGERFDTLALAVLEQSLEVNAVPESLFLVREVVPEEAGIILEPVEDFRGQFGRVGLAHNDHTNNAA